MTGITDLGSHQGIGIPVFLLRSVCLSCRLQEKRKTEGAKVNFFKLSQLSIKSISEIPCTLSLKSH